MSSHFLQMMQRLPTEAFVENDQFLAELSRIFRSRWCFALETSRVDASGDRVCVRVGGRELVAVRGDDGEIRLFPNLCLHKGETFLRPGDAERSTVLRCPHHGWTYALDGRLVAGPGFDLSGRTRTPSLTAVPISRVGSWILTGPEGAQEPTVPQPAGTNLGSNEASSFFAEEIAANWKLVAPALCKRGWSYVLPNLFVSHDGQRTSLVRIEPIAPDLTYVELSGSARGPQERPLGEDGLLDALASEIVPLQPRPLSDPRPVDESALKSLEDALSRSPIDGSVYFLSEDL